MFFKQNKSGETMLVIDIGSSSVGTAIVSVSKGMPAKILFSTRSPVSLPDGSERGHSIAAVIEALELAIKAASAEHVSVHRFHFFFFAMVFFPNYNLEKRF